MSQFDRRTGVKPLRVRGFKNVAFCPTLKAAGINLIRATAFSNRKTAAFQTRIRPFGLFYTLHTPACGGALNKFRGRLSALLEQIRLLTAHTLQSLCLSGNGAL